MSSSVEASASPLDEIREKLRKYPYLLVVDDGDAITVKATTTEGFDVSFFCDGDGYTVGFAGWCELFSSVDPGSALECFAFGLSDSARVRVHSRGGMDYRWTLESLENGEWRKDSTTCLLFFPFWRKKTVRHLRNTTIQTEGIP